MNKRKIGMKYAAVPAAIAAVVLIGAYLVAADSKTEKTAENVFTPDEITLAVIEDGIDVTEAPEKTVSLDWEADTESDGTITYSADKPVSIQNVDETGVNNADAYIRVAIVPEWTSQVTVTTETQAEESSDASSGDEEGITENDTTEVSVTLGTPDVYGLKKFGELTDVSISSVESGSGVTYTMGDVTFTLADNWSSYWFYNPKDGCFYYKSIVEPGSATEKLLASVQISAGTHQIISSYDIQLEIDILADSIQTEGGALDARWSSAGIEINEDGTLKLSGN